MRNLFAFIVLAVAVGLAGFALAGARYEKVSIVQDVDNVSSITVSQTLSASRSGRIVRMWCTSPILTGTSDTYTLALANQDALSLFSLASMSEGQTSDLDYSTTGIWFAGATTVTITESAGQTTSPTFTFRYLYED